MTCELCDIIAGESKAAIIYEDETVIIAARDNVLIAGQITVFPKEHLPILEMMPEALLSHCAVLANAASTAVFESLGAKGTNLLVRNGLGAGQNVPHFSIEVIPRQENDGLPLQWEPKQIMEDEIERTFILLKDELVSLQQQKPKTEEKAAAKNEEISDEIKEEKMKEAPNYLLKSIKRIP